MYTYLYIDIIMTLLVVITYKSSQKKKDIAFWFSILLWVLVCGLREYNVGNDTARYASYFSGKRYSEFFYGTYKEPDGAIELLFVYVVRVIRVFSDSPTFWFLLQSAALFSLWGRYLRKYNPKNALFCLLLFFIIQSTQIQPLMVAMRQTLSICFMLYGLNMFLSNRTDVGKILYRRRQRGISRYTNPNILRKRKKKWYRNKAYWGIAIIVFAMFVHRTSILLFPFVILLNYVHISRRWAYISIGVAMFIALVIPSSIFYYFDLVLSSLASAGAENLKLLSEGYADSNKGDAYGTFTVFIKAATSLGMIYFMDKKQVRSFPFNCLVVSTVMYCLLFQTNMMDRLVLIFQMLAAVVYVPNKMRYNVKAKVFIVLVVVFFLFKSYRTYETWPVKEDSTLPYKFVWE